MTTVRFERDQLMSTAWKNGGGHTREIVRMPAGSGMDTFDWRASIADISADGPFSTFAGFDRVIVLLNGDGVHLRSSNGSVDHMLDEPLVPFSFAGEDAIVATILGSASTDFNVMTRRASRRADMRILRAAERLPAFFAGVLFAARGLWDTHVVGASPTAPAYALRANTGICWDGESLTWDVTPQRADSALIAVGVTQGQEHMNDSIR